MRRAQNDAGLPARSAFSLAELMIAIVILGLGLLFIAAALPVGLSYTRDTLDLAAGEATSEYALDTVEQYLRTSRSLVYTPPGAPPSNIRLDNLFRPRDGSQNLLRQVDGDPGQYRFEPRIKVRPLIGDNIDATPSADLATRTLRSDLGEELIRAWLALVGGATNLSEVDYPFTVLPARSLFHWPAFPSLARVYPPVTPVKPFRAGHFLTNDPNYPQYASRYFSLGEPDAGVHHQEKRKALDRRVAWTAFYRRVSYDGDPLLYEIIVVVARRPSVNHRFAQQDWTRNVMQVLSQPLAYPDVGAPVGPDRLAPVPWLVVFQALPVPPAFFTDGQTGDRFFDTSFPGDAPTLRFTCTQEVGRLLPEGSILIPAVNDDRPGTQPPPPPWPTRSAGFVPHAPQALPIYEVVERPDEFTVIVKNNGFYPWVNLSTGQTPAHWPVWVIPPAFRERDTNGQPVFERRSPILAVARRYIRLREID